MPLPQEAIDELRVIYRREFNQDLPDQEAWAMGYRLAELGRITLLHAARRHDRKRV